MWVDLARGFGFRLDSVTSMSTLRVMLGCIVIDLPYLLDRTTPHYDPTMHVQLSSVVQSS